MRGKLISNDDTEEVMYPGLLMTGITTTLVKP